MYVIGYVCCPTCLLKSQMRTVHVIGCVIGRVKGVYRGCYRVCEKVCDRMCVAPPAC